MVKIMTTIKKSITTNKTTKKATTNVKTHNTFSIKDDVTLKMKVEWNKAMTGLKVQDITDVKTEKSEYKMVVFHDTKGNTLKLYKTAFDFESVVKESKPLAVDLKKIDKLNADEKDALMAILAKLA